MRKSLVALAFLSSTVFSTAGQAQDWTGFYVGTHAGYGWGDWDGKLETTAGCPAACPPNKDAGYLNPYRTIDADGWLGGLQVGYNWRLQGPIVIGFEADISWTDMDGSGTFDTDKYGRSVWSKQHDLELDYFGTARVRLGYAAQSVLPYITGGLAWGKTSGDLAVTYIPPAGVGGTSYASTDENHVGWTIGAGVEYAISSNLSIKAEYLYVDLGDEDYLFKGETYTGLPFDTDSFASDLTFDVVRVGLNYKLGDF